MAVCADGHVVIGRGQLDAPFAVREAGDRMAPLESSVDEPMVRRVGFLGSGRVDLASPADDTLIWIDGPPQRAAGVLASALRAEAQRRHALEAVTLRELRATRADAPLAAYAPRPLGLPRDTGVGLLLARQTALAADLRPDESGTLRIALELRGEFPPGAEDNFRAPRLLDRGVRPRRRARRERRAPDAPYRDRGGAGLPARLPREREILAAGLRTLFVAEMRELLSITPRDPPTSPPTPSSESL
ncbi:MAG: hypothetical protein SangKO_072240 [Sandaracinaceae bacterium]